jgi:hypothetical protein
LQEYIVTPAVAATKRLLRRKEKPGFALSPEVHQFVTGLQQVCQYHS